MNADMSKTRAVVHLGLKLEGLELEGLNDRI